MIKLFNGVAEAMSKSDRAMKPLSRVKTLKENKGEKAKYQRKLNSQVKHQVRQSVREFKHSNMTSR